MRQAFCVFLACLSFGAHAQPAPAGFKEMIATGGLSSGKTYQVVKSQAGKH